MKATQSFRPIGAVAVLVATVLAGMLSTSPRVQAQESEEELSKIGFAIAPVNLNLKGLDPKLVRYGSYLVNALGDCNGCHSSGAPPLGIFPFTTGNNPYFSQKKKIDPDVYLNGGANFGPVGTPTGPLGYAGPNMITRNLTPNYAGMAEGGSTLAQFTQILRTGIDLDGIHPTCTAAQITFIKGNSDPTVPNPVCIPDGPIVYDAHGDAFNNIPNGSLLQIMPWTTFQNLTDTQIQAIYEYLSAIPCIDNTTSTPPAGFPNELRNSCSVPTPANIKDTGVQPSPRSRRTLKRAGNDAIPPDSH
jgi:hypothetical protein